MYSKDMESYREDFPDTDAPHAPTQAWSYRVPSPPRLNVPPPALDKHGMPEFGITQNGSMDFETSGFANVEFLKTVTYDHLIKQNPVLEWKYEQRRQAQEVLPFLWLGPATAARDADFLQKTGITMTLAVRNTLSAQARLLSSKTAERLGIQSKAIDVAGNQELIAAFPRAIEMINLHLSEVYHTNQNSNISEAPGRVLVFCETGNERSAALMVAYIMAMYSTESVPAIQLVQAQRFAVSIDDAMKHLLQSYGDILKAKRDTVHAQNGSSALLQGPIQQPTLARPKSKRQVNEVYDEMETDGNDDDWERFGQRSASAPFQN